MATQVTSFLCVASGSVGSNRCEVKYRGREGCLDDEDSNEYVAYLRFLKIICACMPHTLEGLQDTLFPL